MRTAGSPIRCIALTLAAAAAVGVAGTPAAAATPPPILPTVHLDHESEPPR
jgi:hypothetical protein